MNFSGISPVSSEIPSYPSGNTAQAKLIRWARRHRKQRGSKFICENILKQIAARCLLGAVPPPPSLPPPQPLACSTRLCPLGGGSGH